MFATPDWAKAAAARGPAQRAITPEDLISADGRCAGGPEPVAAAGTDGTNPMPATTAEAVAGQGPLPTVSGGIALAMTECQVAQRAGTPERVDIGADGQDRSVTLTYRQGPWPGIYRFRSGRLVSVERVEVPEPVKPKRPAKPAKPKQQMRG